MLFAIALVPILSFVGAAIDYIRANAACTAMQAALDSTALMNTQNRWYTNAGQIDARQKILCDNAKAANITIYTVQVNTGGNPTSGVLQYCASRADKFYLVTSANQTMTVFNSIGTSLSKLRVAK